MRSVDQIFRLCRLSVVYMRAVVRFSARTREMNTTDACFDEFYENVLFV